MHSNGRVIEGLWPPIGELVKGGPAVAWPHVGNGGIGHTACSRVACDSPAQVAASGVRLKGSPTLGRPLGGLCNLGAALVGACDSQGVVCTLRQLVATQGGGDGSGLCSHNARGSLRAP